MSARSENTIPDEAIRQEVERILQSPMFMQSDRLSRFLRYTVEHVITGNSDSLKEYVIGTEVYDRKPPYHPSQDSIVRTEARRLRSKLKDYYDLNGKDDPIFIFFRPGSYAPVFRMRDSEGTFQAEVEAPQDDLFIEGSGVKVAVIPFLDASVRPVSARYALGVTDEVIHELMQSEGCRVVPVNSIANLGSLVSDVPGLAIKLGVQFIFEGTVREDGNRIRVTGRIINEDGFQLWSQRLDAEIDVASEFEMQEQFASALVSRVRPQTSRVRTSKASAGPLLLSVYPSLLKAESLAEECTVREVHEAIARFGEVAQAAPAYARPFCGIARCYTWLALQGARQTLEYTAKARAAAETAVKLDSEMVDARISLAAVEALEWKWAEAENSLRNAVRLRSHAAANRQLAMLLSRLGRFDEACVYLDAAQRIDPFSYLQKTARATFFLLSRRYDEALEHFTEPLQHGPIPLQALLALAFVYAERGMYEMAEAIADQTARCAGGDLPTMAVVAEIHARCRGRSLAEFIVEKYGLLKESADLSRYRQARLATVLGKSDMALSLLASSFVDKEAELPSIAVDSAFDSIRRMSEFSDLIAKIRLSTTTNESRSLTVI